MNISDIANGMRANALLYGSNSATSSVGGSAAASAITKAFEQADKRVQQQRDVTSAQLSSFGQLKSSFSDVQGAAKALGNLKTDATAADLGKAASAFVTAFNSAVKSAQSSQTQATTVSETTSARRAGTDLRQTIGNNSNLTLGLKKIGITQQADGSLALDSTKFQAAVQAEPAALRATVTQLGQQGQAFAARELADTGNVGSTLKALDSRSRSLQARQTEQQSALASLQASANSQANAYGNRVATGLAAYNNIFANAY